MVQILLKYRQGLLGHQQRFAAEFRSLRNRVRIVLGCRGVCRLGDILRLAGR